MKAEELKLIERRWGGGCCRSRAASIAALANWTRTSFMYGETARGQWDCGPGVGWAPLRGWGKVRPSPYLFDSKGRSSAPMYSSAGPKSVHCLVKYRSGILFALKALTHPGSSFA